MIWECAQTNAYTLLLSMLRERAGAAEMPEMARAPGGKPYFPGMTGLYFNVSHSGGMSLCALSRREVGADVELVRPRRQGLPRYVLSDREFAWYESQGGTWEVFCGLWTLKEARVKCTGQGLVRAPRDIPVPLLAPGGEAEMDGFRFTALSGRLWRGAVCEAVCE